MSEKETILKRATPNTTLSLEAELRQLGLKEGMTVIVHSSLSALGWVSGGAVAVVLALMNVVTEKGTLIMPAHSGDLSDPKYWENPPVPKEWWQTIRDTMPAFNPSHTPTSGMGKIVACFRTFEGVKRSNHPQVSFVAWGKYAKEITDDHQLAYGLGEQSPLQKIYNLNGYVLLLGVGHENNTSLHLSEYYAKIGTTFLSGAPIIDDAGQRIWQTFEDIETDDEVFEIIGKDFEGLHHVAVAKVGNAVAKLMRQKELVDFGTSWFYEKSDH